MQHPQCHTLFHPTVPPVEVRVEAPGRWVSGGQKATFTCRVWGSWPEPVIQWWLGGRHLAPSTTPVSTFFPLIPWHYQWVLFNFNISGVDIILDMSTTAISRGRFLSTLCCCFYMAPSPLFHLASTRCGLKPSLKMIYWRWHLQCHALIPYLVLLPKQIDRLFHYMLIWLL